ncbi:hypothetical protein SAMN04488118_11567 [Epibacterium ulvae]|uniref:Uncharacterized protein n=1 Tax=Epibacterium ulvae TaxID=1156985 RepID=A0A1G5RHP6_9RHOB|nr:hypothetical protein SAMN04488118_11567 [Epibacterium ulvae]
MNCLERAILHPRIEILRYNKKGTSVNECYVNRLLVECSTYWWCAAPWPVHPSHKSSVNVFMSKFGSINPISSTRC